MQRNDKKERAYAKQNRKNMPLAEVILWQNLRRKQLDGFSFRRQHPVKPYIVDFACLAKNLVIEVDGETHIGDTEQRNDLQRTEYLERQGWTIVRFWNWDVEDRLDEVLDTIRNYLSGANESPSAPAGHLPHKWGED